jgi:hypothetical protein
VFLVLRWSSSHLYNRTVPSLEKKTEKQSRIRDFTRKRKGSFESTEVLSIMEACSLCGRVFPYYTFRRCSRCRRLYCGDCITFTWDTDVFRHVAVCLNCARRRVSPRRFGSKYTPLSVYLARRARYVSVVTLSQSKIEEIIRKDLPSSAFGSDRWWTNSRNSVQGRAWLDVGWTVDSVDLSARTATFKKTRSNTAKTHEKTRSWRKGTAEWMKKTPRLTTPRRRRRPSKTTIARAIARLSNIQRERASMRQYRGRLKPKPALEKKLYKPDAKPG